MLGISIGTSTAAGYVTPDGTITPWLNELAFVPIDYNPGARCRRVVGRLGVGSQYFCQQAVGPPHAGRRHRAPAAWLPERQDCAGLAPRATRAPGRFTKPSAPLGYTSRISPFYDLRDLLVLGRVTRGEGGDDIVRGAREVLDVEFPELARRIAFHVPDEQDKRHGQAIAAASLPATRFLKP